MDMHPNDLVKYPRTSHLPFSPGATSDDKWISQAGMDYLSSGIDLVVSTKMDGGNLTLSQTHFHGRSIDSGVHAWDTQAKMIHETIRWDIPLGYRLSCESMYARRSVAYENLPSVLMMFGMWDDTNTLMSWDETVEWAALFDLPTPDVLYRGTDIKAAFSAWSDAGLNDEISEGFVLRDAGRIAYDEFPWKAAKWVRESHVRTNASWRHRDDFELNTFV